MAIIATRLNSDGTLLVNGNLDEVTYNGSTSTSVVKQQPDSISIQGMFDEVTFNATNPTIKNLFTFSQDFTQNWLFQQASTSLSVTSTIELAPDGTNTASKISVNNTSSSFYSFYRGYPCLSNTNYSYSIFVKKAEVSQTGLTVFTTANNSISFNLDTGLQTSTSIGDNLLTINTSTITKVGNDWFRINLGFSRSIAGTFQFKVDLLSGFSTIGNGLNVWGAQLEQSLTPTIYQGITNANTLVTSSIARKIDKQGNYYLKNQFDEFTGAPVVDSSLVFWLDAAQPISYSGVGNTWTSIVNSTYTGILNNGLVFNSQNGGFLTFDGVDDNVFFSSPGLTTSTTVATIEMLANIKQTGARMPFGFVGYDVYLAAGAMGYNTGNSDSYGINTATVTSLGIVGNWKHYAFVMKNNVNLTTNPYTSNKIYVNGVNQTLTQILNTQSGSIRTFNNGDGVISGWRNLDATTTTYRIPMDLAIFKIYNRELSEDEIQQNFNALRRRYNI